MAGLLDGIFGGEPRQQGLLAGGPSRTPVSFGQALAQGFGAGQWAYQNAQEAGRKQLREERLKLLADAEQRQRDEQRRRQQSQAVAPKFGAVEGVSELPPEDMTALSVPPLGESPVERFNRQVRVIKPLKAMLPAKPLAPVSKRNVLVNKPPKPFGSWPSR